MRTLQLHHLVSGPRPHPSRIFFHNVWFRGHNNSRYAELLPRLGRIDAYLITCSRDRFVRRAQMGTLSATRRLRGGLIFALAGRRYRSMLYTGGLDGSLPRFRGRVVVDIDDPRFDENDVRVLNSSNVRAYVVTADLAARRFSTMGVRKPHVVIPQGVSLRTLSDARMKEVADTYRTPGVFVAGYMASFLRSRADRGGENPMYNVDHLLDLWDEIRVRVPQANLWLLGQASQRIIDRCAGRKDILVLGRVPRDSVLAYVANFDVALYPRTKDQGVRAAKIAEYMGAGVPTVSYDFQVTEPLREHHAGVLVHTPSEFVSALESLSLDRPRLLALAAGARAAGLQLDWDILAAKYHEEVFEKYLA